MRANRPPKDKPTYKKTFLQSRSVSCQKKENSARCGISPRAVQNNKVTSPKEPIKKADPKGVNAYASRGKNRQRPEPGAGTPAR